jgi:hypothetical protein
MEEIMKVKALCWVLLLGVGLLLAEGPAASDGTAAASTLGFTLTVDVEPAGTGSVAVDPPGPYDYGDPVTLTAVPESGWGFDHWSGDLGGSSNPAVITILGDMEVTAHFDTLQYALTVEIDPPGTGTVTMEPPGPYQHGQVVTLTANPVLGWEFDHWSGDVTGTLNPVVKVITGDALVTAHFLESEYTVAVNVDPPGGGSVTREPPGPYAYGETVVLTALPNGGYGFTNWSGDLAGSANPETVEVVDDMNVTAHFDSVELILTVDVDPAEGGTVTMEPAGPYYLGDPVTLTAVPATGWQFDHWSGDLSGTLNPVVIVMNDDKVVTANFVLEEYSVVVDVDPPGSGWVTMEPAAPCHYGDTVTITASPAADWVFDHWSGDHSDTANPAVVEVFGDMHVTANFVSDISGVTDRDTPRSLTDKLHGTYPNPFTGKATIRFDLRHARTVTLSIYDISGQLVRTLVDGPIPAGEHQVEWDARDTALRPVRPGVYFYRIRAGDFDETGRLVVLE